MRYSPKGMQLTMDAEGVRLTAYQDTGGVWTIGFGHTANVRNGQVITMDQAEALLSLDTEASVHTVNTLVKVPLTQGQFDALVDFVFNLGEERFRTSTLLRKLNGGDYTGAATEFQRWNKDNGKVLAGLVKRCKAREVLFNS